MMAVEQKVEESCGIPGFRQLVRETCQGVECESQQLPAEATLDRARSAYSRRDYDEALALLQSQLQELQDPQASERGEALELALRVCERSERPDEALAYASEWVEWTKRSGENLTLARALSAKAETLEALGRLDEARQVRLEALDLAKKTWGTSGSFVALARLALADVLRAQSAYPDAEAQYIEALTELEGKSNRFHTAWVLEHYAVLLDQTGRHEEAQRLRARAAVIEAEADAASEASGIWKDTPLP
ncbi:MAG TPA: tetratricopeptide repeat protein [Myxococcota bacterium]|nr:tetratricopeptide repeat protein [Myxococcota bacterium]